MFTHASTSVRKALLICICVGIAVAVLTGSLHFLMAWHKREVKNDTLISDMQQYLVSYFSDLKATADILQPFTFNSCQQVASELTSRAAFTLNVRAFLLVKDKIAFCSSATGAMKIAVAELAPIIDTRKNIDMVILHGTPMMPDKPAMVIWYRNPLFRESGVFTSLNVNLAPYLTYTRHQEDFNGIALVVGDAVLSTFSAQVMTVKDLPGSPVREAGVTGLPLKIQLFAPRWTYSDIGYALLLGGMSGIIVGLLCFYLYSVRLRPGRALIMGIRREQFYLVYQPVVETRTLKVTGLEVLLRWRHPTAGEIPPDIFIHFAEVQQLITPLTRHLFKLIARDAPTLQKVLPAGSKLGINIAPDHLHSEGFKEDIRQLSASLPPHHFRPVLEITERDMLNHLEATKLFDWLHDNGFEIAIDDFGTGHSALIYLERFTFDYLKIDRGFIKAIGQETVTSPVLDAVLALSKRLNMLTIAEGVETPEQARWLQERGVNFLQGFWISRPLKLADFVRWFKTRPEQPD
ncbi:TPA: cyclic di-GMP phosphodiesterase [Citrobacter freundii]